MVNTRDVNLARLSGFNQGAPSQRFLSSTDSVDVERRKNAGLSVERCKPTFTKRSDDNKRPISFQRDWGVAAPVVNPVRCAQEPAVIMSGEHVPVVAGVKDSIKVFV